MHLRHLLAIVGIVGLLAVPATAAGGSGVVASASGGIHWTIALPNPFEVEVRNQPLAFNAKRYADGTVRNSNDPTIPPGTFAWFQVFDNGEGANSPPDQSSLIGFGNEAANEAFCNSPNLPRFGPWDVEGNVQVRS
jgi:hypothetical protein